MSLSYDSCANGAISVDGVPELLARIHGPSSEPDLLRSIALTCIAKVRLSP